MSLQENKIAIIGLGYVGLPLAVEFGKKFKTIGFDINENRINELNKGIDSTLEVSNEHLGETLTNNLFSVTSDKTKIADCTIYIVTVPTPINQFKSPDLTPLLKASKMIGRVLKKGDIVICVTNKMYGMTFLLEVGEQYQIDAFTEVGEKNLVSVTNIKNNQDIGVFDDKHFMPLNIWREFQLRKILE